MAVDTLGEAWGVHRESLGVSLDTLGEAWGVHSGLWEFRGSWLGFPSGSLGAPWGAVT